MVDGDEGSTTIVSTPTVVRGRPESTSVQVAPRVSPPAALRAMTRRTQPLTMCMFPPSISPAQKGRFADSGDFLILQSPAANCNELALSPRPSHSNLFLVCLACV